MRCSQRRIFGPAILCSVLCLISHWAFAQSPSELLFQSRHDQFQLRRSGGGYKLAERSVKLGSFEQFLPLFSQEIEGGCNSLGKADLTVKAKVGNKWVERRFYMDSHTVGDGKQCASVSGEGIYYSPLHRSWFDDNGKASIHLESPLVISRGDEKLAAFELVRGEWQSSMKDEFPNWEFFNLFKNSLQDFAITNRMHKAMAADKPGFVLTSGKKKYEFHKITPTMWATALQGQGWLVASPLWSSWNDMEKSQWMDRSGGQLTVLADRNKPLEERRAALNSLDGQWTPSIRQVLAQILTDKEESAELKADALRLMRTKPSLENMGTLVQALSQTDDSDLQYALSQALKLRYPKGPTISVDFEEGDRQKAIGEWQTWWKGQKNSKD
ncbi:MAG: hypothetical protein AB7N80_02600 [Bdellovibrionales bacterium]